MINKKKTVILIIAALIISAGVFYYYKYYRNNPASESEFFQITDNPDKIIWSENLELTDEARRNYEQRIADAQARLQTEAEVLNLVVYYNDMGLFNTYLGDYRAAYELYLKSLEVKSDFRRTWLALGDVLLKMQAEQSAEAAYQKAIELFNYDALGYNKLAKLYAQIYPDDIAKTRQVYEDGLAVLRNNTSDDTPLLRQYVKWLVEIEDKEEAIKIYQELIEREPENKEAYERDIRQLK